MNKEKLQRGLGLFLDAMRPYAVSIITRECHEGRSWDVDFEQKIDSEHKRTSWQMQRMQLNNNFKESPLQAMKGEMGEILSCNRYFSVCGVKMSIQR